MIPTAEVRAVAEEVGLLPTTIEKDFALGWVLFGIARHPSMRSWIFKGGTCLKKCFFDTYRFSEDLDFTLPDGSSVGAIHDGLREVGRWVFDASGIEVPEDGIEVEESVNKQGQVTHLAKLTFRGPLGLPRHSRQRIKFDLTHHELIADTPCPPAGVPPVFRCTRTCADRSLLQPGRAVGRENSSAGPESWSGERPV